eukprot:2423020-Pyramimonas_sp.AAC.1
MTCQSHFRLGDGPCEVFGDFEVTARSVTAPFRAPKADAMRQREVPPEVAQEPRTVGLVPRQEEYFEIVKT